MLKDLSFLLNGVSLAFFAMAALHMTIYARQMQSRPHLIFAFCLIWMVFIETKEFFISQDPLYDYEILEAWYSFPDLFTLPLLSLFFFELVMPGRITLGYSLKLLTPFLLLAAAYILGSCFRTYQSYLSFSEFTDDLPAFQPTILLLYILYSIGYSIFAVHRVVVYSRRYAREIAQAYSFTERIHLQWMRGMAAFMAFYLLAYIITIAYASGIAYTVFIYLLTLGAWAAIYAYILAYCIPDIIRDYWRMSDNDTHEEISEPDERTETLRQQVALALGERQLYLNPSLTIIDLATECGTNRTNLSQFFNNHLKASFRDYINRCRIDYATQLMTQGKYKIEELAMLSGFGSAVTFYRAFYREKNMTPTQWIESRRGGGNHPTSLEAD